MSASETEEQARFDALMDGIFKRAGGTLSLSEAAERLGTTRETLYERILKGEVLGFMQGDRLVLPCCQFRVGVGEPTVVLPAIADVVGMFDRAGAGRLSCLQWMVHHDGNLEQAPIAALLAGKPDDVRKAARAWLELDRS